MDLAAQGFELSRLQRIGLFILFMGLAWTAFGILGWLGSVVFWIGERRQGKQLPVSFLFNWFSSWFDATFFLFTAGLLLWTICITVLGWSVNGMAGSETTPTWLASCRTITCLAWTSLGQFVLFFVLLGLLLVLLVSLADGARRWLRH
jgi:hypothetical protein